MLISFSLGEHPRKCKVNLVSEVILVSHCLQSHCLLSLKVLVGSSLRIY